MKLESGILIAPVRAPAPESKPLSASVCHILAIAGFLGAVLWALLTALGFWDSSGFYIAIGSAVGGVVWWVMGDARVSIARRHR